MKKSLLSLFFIINFILSSTYSVPASVTTFAPHAVFMVNPGMFAFFYARLNSILEQHFKIIQNEKIINFVNQEIKKRTDKKIRLFVGDPAYLFMPGHLACAFLEDIIVISPAYFEILEKLFAQEHFTAQDQKTVNIFRFIIHHELGHLITKDSQKRLYASIAIAIAKSALFETAKRTFDFKYAHIISFLTINTLGNILQSLHNKQLEYIADDMIESPEAIEGGKLFLKNIIDLANKNDEVYWQDKISFSHPTSQERLDRLENRFKNVIAA